MNEVSTDNIWNSFEIIKVIVSIITPVVITFIGFRMNSIFHKLEKSQWVNKTIIEWKIKVYEQITPEVNDIYCFFMYVGNWSNISPLEVIEKKRNLDKIISLSYPLFSNQVKTSYDSLIDCLFEEYRGKGKDLGLKTGYDSREKYSDAWNVSWRDLFVDNKSERTVITERYELFLKNLANDLNLSLNIN